MRWQLKKRVKTKPPAQEARLGDNKLLLTIVPAVISALVAVGAAAYSSSQASRAQGEAQKLETFKISRSERMKVYERVEAQLASESPYGLLIADGYTRIIEEPQVKKDLCELIGVVAASKVQAQQSATPGGPSLSVMEVLRRARQCAHLIDVGRAELTKQNGAAAANNASAADLEKAAGGEGSTGQDLTANPNQRGWDVDVFACAGHGQASQRLAKDVADRLADLARRGESLGGQELGRVRLRNASEAAQAALYSAPLGNSVLRSDDEADFAEAVRRLANSSDPQPNFGVLPAPATTPWYVSVFACGPPR
jgi:hypothetical protein